MYHKIFCLAYTFLSVAFAQSDYWTTPTTSEAKSLVNETSKYAVGVMNQHTTDKFYSAIYKMYKGYYHLNPHKALVLVFLQTTNCTKNSTCKPEPLTEVKGCCQFQPDTIAKFQQCEIIFDVRKDPINKGNIESENCTLTTKANADNLMYSAFI